MTENFRDMQERYDWARDKREDEEEDSCSSCLCHCCIAECKHVCKALYPCGSPVTKCSEHICGEDF